MNNLTVYIKSTKIGIPGFNQDNNFSLQFILPKNSTTLDLLNNLNQFRIPKNRILTLHDSNGNIIVNRKLKDQDIFII